MRCCLAPILALLCLDISAQDPGILAVRHQRIKDLYAAERHKLVVEEVERQLRDAIGSTWQDSLYLYTYKYARAKWKTEGAEVGTNAGEHVLALVQKYDSDPVHLLEAYSDLSWIYYETGRMDQCVRVDSLAIIVADRYPQVPLLMRGRTRQYLAFDHSARSDHKKAVKYFEEAARIYLSGDRVSPKHLSESYNGAGVSHMHLGHFKEAEKYFKLALDHLPDVGDVAILGRRASTYGNLGVLWQSAGDLARSRSYYHQSLKLNDRVVDLATDPYQRDEAILNRSRSYLNLATVYFGVGDHHRSRELLELCAADRRTILEPGDPQLLAVQDRMAELELAEGSYQRAAELVGAYAEACRLSYGEVSTEYARSLAKLAQIKAEQGELQQADPLYQRSIGLRSRIVDPVMDRELATILLQRGIILLDHGDRSAALADLERAGTIYANLHGPRHDRSIECLNMQARAHLEAGRPQRALAIAEEAFDGLQDRMAALQRNELPQMLPQPHLLSETILYKVKAQQALQSISKQEMIDQLAVAVRSLERGLATLQDEEARLTLVGAQKEIFDLAVDLAFEVHEQDAGERTIDQFLAFAEADRSILLRNRLNMFASLRFAGLPDHMVERERQLLQALQVDHADPTTALELHQNEAALQAFLDSLSHASPRYYALRYGAPPANLEDIREQLLDEGRQFLAYVTTKQHIYALVVRRDTAALVRMPLDDLEEQVSAFNDAVASHDISAYREHAHRLYMSIMRPVEHLLVEEGLAILPDGGLYRVNFEALLTSDQGNDHKDHLLIRKHTISYLLSATTAIQFAQGIRSAGTGALAVAPGFTDSMKQDHLASTDPASVDREYLHLVRQPFAVGAAEKLRSILSANVLLGAQASERNFRDQAQRYGILHFGTHAEVNAVSPLYSRLVLSKTAPTDDPTADGYLHAYEIYEMELRAQLAVLSACETGAGRYDAGEGIRSLGHGFAYAGCPSLVMSLWKIDEKVSSDILTRFYEHLAKGMAKDQALRQAKLDHLEHAPEELSLPYYWAGLVLVGDPSPIDDGPGLFTYAGYWAGGLLLLVLAGTAWVLWRRRG